MAGIREEGEQVSNLLGLDREKLKSVWFGVGYCWKIVKMIGWSNLDALNEVCCNLIR